jgi:hypothetical protein
VRQHARFWVASAEKLLGALPVIAGFSSRLKIRDIIDEACPVRDLAALTHGQVIEALVAYPGRGLIDSLKDIAATCTKPAGE